MVDDSPKHHWVRLACGYDLELRHGVPVRLSDNGVPAGVSDEALVQEIAELTGLDADLGSWSPGEEGDSEVPVMVVREQFGRVMERLARSSAVLFVDRYHKAIDEIDVDWDREEFGLDFGTALEFCHIKRGELDPESYFEDYARVMHEETRRLVESRR